MGTFSRAYVVQRPAPEHLWPTHPKHPAFRAARDLMLRQRSDYDAARAAFRWPVLSRFNWALDWFDVVAGEHPNRTALRIVEEDGAETRLSCA